MANRLHFKSIQKKHNNVWNNKAYLSIAETHFLIIYSKEKDKTWRFQVQY